MYVVTFYSFKGGVGRSMALVNVAAELVKRKKRVLIVDFDLEAPGLDTFDITHTESNCCGLLDFVWDFRMTGEVPDVKNYVYRAPLDVSEGELWVMSAGRQDSDYDHRFQTLNWEQLYNEQEGFLLFEDLKAQWKDVLEVDYVLIDSRTGHTDVGGICTRQMPDAVVALFFPNEQNRRGLQSVLSQVRNEVNGPLKKRIDLHFVMANVPFLDDEDEILHREIARFKESLKFDTLSAVIHHYDSLALLEQVTFIRERGRSRLAKEYKELALAIMRKNLEDREGALAFLEVAGNRMRSGNFVQDLENQLQEIRIKHPKDVEILGKLADSRVRQRKSEEALAILTEALNLDMSGPDLLIRRAQLCFSLGQKERAVGDLKQVLSLPDVTSFDLSVAVRMLREIQPDLVRLISRSPALDRLESDTDLIRELESSPETLPLAVKLLVRWLPSEKGLTNELVMCLIGKGEYMEAETLLGGEHVNPDQLDVPECFNYAMASWGTKGAPSVEHLRRVLKPSGDSRRLFDPNYLQCLSLANYMIGEKELGYELLQRSREVGVTRGASAFSCWSYLNVSVERFTSDLEEMEASFRSNNVVPEFLRRNSSAAFDPMLNPIANIAIQKDREPSPSE